METITFEVALSVQEVVDALPELHQKFLRRKQITTRGAPFVQCSELTARLTLSGIPDHPAWPKPDADSIEQFKFFADWKQPQRAIVQVWTVQVEARGRGSRLTLYPMGDQLADCRDFYSLFAALVEAWAAQVEQEETGTEILRDALETPDEAPPTKRGVNASTVERLLELHKLLNSRKYTHNQAHAMVKKKFGKGIDQRTYEGRCKEVTGDDPIYPPKKMM